MKRRSVNPSIKYGILLRVVFVVFSLTKTIAFAADPVIGRVAAFSGPVFVNNSSGRVDASKGLGLGETDELTTGAAGVVQVKFNDGTSFTLYENSSIKIDKYRSARKAAQGMTESAFEVLQGKLRFFVKPTKEKKNETQFKSKSAVMGIRGTSGLIGVNQAGETSLVVFSGLVEVSNPKFPDVKISVAPNFQTKIGLGTSPQLPKPVSAETLKSIVPETSKEAGFTEDGIESPMPDSRPSDSPAKGTDQGTEDQEPVSYTHLTLPTKA